MPSVLITGASRGLGLEFVRQYADAGWQVYATCRDPDAADGLRPLLRQGVQVLPLDIADPGSIAALAAALSGVALDLLINNAGIMGAKTHQDFGTVDGEAYLAAQRTNALGPMLLTQALLPNLRAAVRDQGQAKVAMVSSRMGSISENTGGGCHLYRASKAALNALSRGMALDLGALSIHLAVLHPGWVRTEMGGPGGQIDPPQSVAGMRRVIDHLTADQSGCFVDYQGKDVAW
jgi:NAD(P)-dependent dehydrogenase (short-subunit alcohol dehydrogenase family)